MHGNSNIKKATNTQSEYVIIIIAFPLQQWLRERASLLRYTYIACLVKCYYNGVQVLKKCSNNNKVVTVP